MKTIVAVIVSLLVFPVVSAHADEWHVGPGLAYVSNINEVVDVYRANLIAEGKTVSVDKPFPVGIAFDANYQWNSGPRIGFGLGPYLRLSGDVDHFELPINGTVGYSFDPQNSFAPYVKGGVVHHFAKGDYYESSQPGLLVAGGVEMGQPSLRFVVEVSFDASKIELDTIPGGAEKFRTYETVISFFLKF